MSPGLLDQSVSEILSTPDMFYTQSDETIPLKRQVTDGNQGL